MNDSIVLGIFLIALFSAIIIVLAVILYDSIKNNKPIGKRIPESLKKLQNYAQHRHSRK